MALYKYDQAVSRSQHANFDKLYAPGHTAIDAGIYRCAGCGDEISIAGGHILPPQNHHQHSREQGDIAWQLIVASVSIR